MLLRFQLKSNEENVNSNSLICDMLANEQAVAQNLLETRS